MNSHHTGFIALAKHWLSATLLALLVAGCAGPPVRPAASGQPSASQTDRRQEIALFALGLLDTGYRFGGKNPEAGLDCSGMVAYVFRESAGIPLAGSAADIARRGRKIDPAKAEAGDLVFFDTRGGPYTHVGIALGDGRFVHAPSSTRGKIRVDSVADAYFSKRFTEARSYLD